MLAKIPARYVVVLAALGLFATTAFADEIVHFTNGSEMPVKSHSVEKEKSMVKLDLGGNSFISFPMSMVEKIVSAGQDVFLNPGFHPSNQAIAGIPGTQVADTTVHGTSTPVGLQRQPDGKGHAGMMLGEAADVIPAGYPGGAQVNDAGVAQSRKRFNPAFPPVPGGPPQVIMPPNVKAKVPAQFQPMQPAGVTTPPPPPPPPPAQDNPPADPPAEDPPDNP